MGSGGAGERGSGGAGGILSSPLVPVFSCLLVLAGYFGPWINHRAAVLVVTGLDLGEYVKFLPVVQQGQLSIWREGFYLPLVTVSLMLSLRAFRHAAGRGKARPATTRSMAKHAGDRLVDPFASGDAHSAAEPTTNALKRVSQTGRRFQSMPVMAHAATWLLRLVMLALATVAALNLLPPAWTPGLLLKPEFRLQTLTLALCLAAVAVSPLLALLPRIVPSTLVVILLLASLWWPISGFLRVLPNIEALYNEPLRPGWGMYVMIAGLALNFGFTILDLRSTRDHEHSEPNPNSKI